MISLYEGILADMEDSITTGDDIVDNIVINNDDSVLKKIFQVKPGKEAFTLKQENDKKILTVNHASKMNRWVYCANGNISDVINIDELVIENCASISTSNKDISKCLCKTIISDRISISDAVEIKNVELIAKDTNPAEFKYSASIDFDDNIKKLSNCKLEIYNNQITTDLIFNSIPEFNNVKSNTVKHIVFKPNVLTSTLASSILDDCNALQNLFDFGYSTTYMLGKSGIDNTIKIKNIKDLRKIVRAKDADKRCYSDNPVKLKPNARLRDVIDVSKFNNIETIIMGDGKMGILFINTNNAKANSSLNKFFNRYIYSMLKKTNDTINDLPVTADGWKVIVYKW